MRINRDRRLLDPGILKSQLGRLAQLGVKNVIYTGQGDPLLHPELTNIISFTKNLGIDVALKTTGVWLSNSFARASLGALTWLRAEVNAGTRVTYALVHGRRLEDWDTLWEKMASTARVGRETNSACAVGIEMQLTSQLRDQAGLLTERCKSYGLDHIVVVSGEPLPAVFKRGLHGLEEGGFKVVFREPACVGSQDYFTTCMTVPSFWAFIDPLGDVYGCNRHVHRSALHYGNILEQSVEEIWSGQVRRRAQQFVKDELDISECRSRCPVGRMNSYLWGVRTRTSH